MLPQLLEQGTLFDAIYFDTFAEDYKAFRLFFSEHLFGLLEDKGRWSFFNGEAAPSYAEVSFTDNYADTAHSAGLGAE